MARNRDDQAEAAVAAITKDGDATVGSGRDGKPEITLRRSPMFSRMRLDWKSEDRPVIQRAAASVEARIQANFVDAYQVMFDLYMIVREPVVDEDTGEIQKDRWGFPEWQRGVSGSYVEDFTRLTRGQKENFLFLITTHIFEWQQAAADAWGEAMFAKAQWEETLSLGFDRPMSGTVQDREHAGKLHARDERYFSIFLSLYSRKADAICASMELLGQRLKDTLDV